MKLVTSLFMKKKVVSQGEKRTESEPWDKKKKKSKDYDADQFIRDIRDDVPVSPQPQPNIPVQHRGPVKAFTQQDLEKMKADLVAAEKEFMERQKNNPKLCRSCSIGEYKIDQHYDPASNQIKHIVTCTNCEFKRTVLSTDVVEVKVIEPEVEECQDPSETNTLKN